MDKLKPDIELTQCRDAAVAARYPAADEVSAVTMEIEKVDVKSDIHAFIVSRPVGGFCTRPMSSKGRGVAVSFIVPDVMC